jgi:hypothetical protein
MPNLAKVTVFVELSVKIYRASAEARTTATQQYF